MHPLPLQKLILGSRQISGLGKGGVTGTAGGWGFGANFKVLTDESGNVSWNVLSPENLIDKGSVNGGIAYSNDPQACANPVYKWFKEYAKKSDYLQLM